MTSFIEELNFRLNDYIKFGSRRIGWKFVIPDYYVSGRETEFGFAPISYFGDHSRFNKEVEEWLKGRIQKILIGENDPRSCKWSNVYMRHSTIYSLTNVQYTKGKFDKGHFPHMFYDEVGEGDTIEICYCSKFIWFWWCFKSKWMKITGGIIGIITFLYSLINYKLIFKLISGLFKLLNKS